MYVKASLNKSKSDVVSHAACRDIFVMFSWYQNTFSQHEFCEHHHGVYLMWNNHLTANSLCLSSLPIEDVADAASGATLSPGLLPLCSVAK